MRFPTVIRAIQAAIVAVGATTALAVGPIGPGTAHADPCAGAYVKITSTELYAHGWITTQHMGTLYLWYRPACRSEYASILWDKNWTDATDGYIEVRDAYGDRAGTAEVTNQIGQAGQVSALISIDRGNFYYHSLAFMHIGTTGGIPMCIGSTDFYTGWHNYYTGYNSNDHPKQTCSGPS
ncbi:hypothetical protein [Embleya sp. AB8]|uniref:hypothetical protein n=1 Tax=Embleya sp. AB8 TaxID=3156304 RepID=UPI003C726D4E